MTRTVATKLAEARKLIERGWCRGSFARSKTNRNVGVLSPSACQFCAVGAMMRAHQSEFVVDVTHELRMLRRAAGDDNMAAWNDAPERTQAEVIEAFKRAEQLTGAE